MKQVTCDSQGSHDTCHLQYVCKFHCAHVQYVCMDVYSENVSELTLKLKQVSEIEASF